MRQDQVMSPSMLRTRKLSLGPREPVNGRSFGLGPRMRIVIMRLMGFVITCLRIQHALAAAYPYVPLHFFPFSLKKP